MSRLYHTSDHFRANNDDRVKARPDDETEPSKAMVQTLLKHVRNQFYTERPAEKFFQDEKRLMMVLTWPATWLNQRGVGLPLDRYESILREIILEIQRHGATGKIEFFPAYFEKTVKAWFIHNGEALYEERKSLRNAMDLSFLKGMKAQVPTGPDPMEILAQANRMLASTRKRSKPQSPDQMSLL